LRYYAPVAPITIAATTATLIDSWRSGGDRRMIVAATVSTTTAIAVTGYLVRAVNVPMLSGAMPVDSSERRRTIRTWHRVNGARMAAVAGAWYTLRRAARPAR
jgi:hypothetical protein